jgi:hypothetical protein
VRKSRKSASEKEEELEKALKGEREKAKQASADHAKEREELEGKIEALEERKLQLTGELEKANN